LLNSSGESPAQRRLLTAPQEGSLLLPETEEAFASLQSLVLDLHRLVYKQVVFHESGSSGARAEGARDTRKTQGVE
jgi:hypothetical protein